MMTRILLILLCLGVLSTVNGCYFDPAPYGVSSYEGSGVGAYQGEPYGRVYERGRDEEERQYRRSQRAQEREQEPAHQRWIDERQRERGLQYGPWR